VRRLITGYIFVEGGISENFRSRANKKTGSTMTAKPVSETNPTIGQE
jgi:hypothetical protein